MWDGASCGSVGTSLAGLLLGRSTNTPTSGAHEPVRVGARGDRAEPTWFGAYAGLGAWRKLGEIRGGSGGVRHSRALACQAAALIGWGQAVCSL